MSTGTVKTSTSVLLHVNNVTQWWKNLTTEKEGKSPTNTANEISCQVGYKLIERTCVRLSLQMKSFYWARKACTTDGAELAMPKTRELDVALRDLVHREGQGRAYWIGMRDREPFFLRKRVWKWMDGSRLGEYEGWGPGEPNNRRILHTVKLCVQYSSCDSQSAIPMWSDTYCRRKFKFICQAPLANVFHDLPIAK
ncbi:C-type lectin lectoxin-Phi1-like [Branchiostoma floridae x Branchiostoma belcheri]